MTGAESVDLSVVTCRIGSLEKRLEGVRFGIPVTCRIGSLEKNAKRLSITGYVTCRIGSFRK